MKNWHWVLCPVLALLSCRAGTGEQPRPADDPPAFQWTDAPRLEDIPAGPIRGEINGRPFEAKWVGVQPGTHESWRINVAEQEPTGGDLGLFHEVQFATVFLFEPPAAGKRYERAMAHDDKGFIHVLKSESPRVTENWHSECAFAAEFTAWDAREWDPGIQASQLAGRAAGRLALTCRARDGVKASWLAGEFSGAPVRYMGPPWWIANDRRDEPLDTD